MKVPRLPFHYLIISRSLLEGRLDENKELSSQLTNRSRFAPVLFRFGSIKTQGPNRYDSGLDYSL